jgi:hypothetical protein
MILYDIPGSLKKGLNSSQVKFTALIFMTLDHIAVYLTALPAVNAAYEMIRTAGRIAAPLFLYVLAQGLHHTKSKAKYALRLYLASLAMAVMNMAVRYIPLGRNSATPTDNIFATFFYVALYVLLLEMIIQAGKERKPEKIILPLIIMLTTFGFVFIEKYVYNLTSLPDVIRDVIIRVTGAVFPNPFTVEYSFVFILLGIAWYFISSKKLQIVLFLSLCLASGLFMGRIPVFFHFRFFELFIPGQFWMFLSLPFLWLYNGNKGRSMKYFFYIYYSLHIYVLYIIGRMLT